MRDPDPLDRLRAARGFVFDMDGTLVLGDRQSHGLRPLPGAVLAGWFPEFTMPALEAACHAVWGGAELYTPMTTCPPPGGRTCRCGASTNC